MKSLVVLVLVALTAIACGSATSPAASDPESTTPDPSPVPAEPEPALSAPPIALAETSSTGEAEPSQEPQPLPDADSDDALRGALLASATAQSLAHLRGVPPALLDASCSLPGILPLSQWLDNHPADGVRSEAACLDGRCALVFTSIGARTAVELAVFYRLVGQSVADIRCEVRRAG